MSLSIRLASREDAQPVASLDEIVRGSSQRRPFIEKAISRKECFVAIVDGRIVGYAALDYTFFENGFVSTLMADPKHRLMGVGTALMRHLESVCETPKLFTSTNLSNLPMQGLLAKLGYELSGVIHNLDPGDPELVYVNGRGIIEDLSPE